MCDLEECYIKPGSTNNRQSLSCLLRKVDPVSAHIVLLRVKRKAEPGKNSLEQQRERLSNAKELLLSNFTRVKNSASPLNKY